MASVTSSLFGTLADMGSPETLLQQRVEKAYGGNRRPGDVFFNASAGAGEQLLQSTQKLFGMEDEQVKQQRKLQAIIQGVQTQVDLSTPDGLSELANRLNEFPEFSGIALAMRQEAAKAKLAANEANLKQGFLRAQTETERYKQTKLAAEAEKALRVEDNPNLEKIDLNDKVIYVDKRTGSIVQEYQKGLTPEQKRKQAQGSDEEKAGYIGKTGAYRNSFGEVFSATEMAKQRAGFDSAESILKDINKIDGTTIRQAEGFFDVTEPGITQKIASQVSPKTVEAQTKIAAIELQKRLEALPPGSASDADMRQAARGFPGFGDAQALKNWVNETKEKLEFSLAKQNERYGFNRKIKATAPVEFGKQKAKEQKPSSDVPAGVDPAVWSVMTPEEKALWK